MCAASDCSLHSSSGDETAIASATQPVANANASIGRTPDP
jgi:hypothetical protein